MQINSTYNVVNLNEASSKSSSSANEITDVSKKQKETSDIETPSLKTMSLEEIQTYLENKGIEDEDGSRAKILLDIQEFAPKVSEDTYNKMTNALMNEKNSSWASMRYASFPSSEILDENPKIFHALLETTLGMEDTAHALIFNLDFKKDFSAYNSPYNSQSQGITKPSLDLETDFTAMNFFGFMQKRLEEMEEAAKDGFSLQEQNLFSDFKLLFENYNSMDENMVSPETNIWV